MESIQRSVYYCSVSKSGQILYSYNGGEPEIEKLGAQCLEKSPPYHQWYFQTMGKRTFGFLMDEVYQYFVIVNETLGKAEAFKFLEHLRDEFRTLTSKGLSRSMSNLNSLRFQEQLVPVIRRLVTSLENVSCIPTEWPVEVSSSDQINPSDCNSNTIGPSGEGSVSTRAPLLGKTTKKEKKKMKDHVISISDIELEEQRQSSERGNKVDSGPLDSANGQTPTPPISLQKESGSFRTRSSSQNVRKKLCRQVRIILAIDAVVCVVLFVIWLLICNGLSCVHIS
ncbi:hypothetical protein LIER_27077 [Lithospermum erythrorhizon]|uniref:Longin domain-containing protein n=1 Tax=Lithospermum erythrorhizon TaxID=34254 RepID=A0AAV3RCC0_LITER